MAPPPDNRLVRVRVLRADPDEVARVKEIFADGMRSLSPGVVRSGLRNRRVWLLAAGVGALAAAWTSRADAAPFSLVRSAIIASLSFLAAYACYLSTIMENYVQESLQDDLRDPVQFYRVANGGGGGAGADNHSSFWVAELIDAPPTTTPDRLRQQAQQQEEANAAPSASASRPTLRRRLLNLAGVLAENEARVKEEELAEARAMLAPSGTPRSSSTSIVGCVALQHKPGEDKAELRRMSVAEEARGRGVAVALAEALERHAKARGLKSVFCTTSSLQAPARALYGGKLGWVEVTMPGHVKHKQAEDNGITFHRYERVF
jgi:ribosomal protein S18 acetylase RimI-like enzyme